MRTWLPYMLVLRSHRSNLNDSQSVDFSFSISSWGWYHWLILTLCMCERIPSKNSYCMSIGGASFIIYCMLTLMNCGICTRVCSILAQYDTRAIKLGYHGYFQLLVCCASKHSKAFMKFDNNPFALNFYYYLISLEWHISCDPNLATYAHLSHPSPCLLYQLSNFGINLTRFNYSPAILLLGARPVASWNHLVVHYTHEGAPIIFLLSNVPKNVWQL